MDDTFRSFQLDLNAGNHTISLAKPDEPKWKAELSYRGPDGDSLILEGAFESHAIQAKLKRFKEPGFLLLSRGFHWIQEYPFNR